MKLKIRTLLLALSLAVGVTAGAVDLGSLGNFINNTIANNNFTIDDLTGSWQYTSPAVSFQSENALQNIGGAAAATALENQLDPYFRRLGFNRSSLEVNADHTFTLRLGLVSLKGTVAKNSDDMLEFNFNAFGRVPLGKLTANATKSGDTLNLTFDATKFINILSTVAGSLNNASLTALTGMLNSYDGVYIGFKMRSRAADR